IYINGLESNGIQELLAPGNYQLELHNSSGCTSNHSFIIEHATPIDINLNSGTIECYGETTEIEVIASGGNGAFVVDWNSIDSLNISAGDYELSVTDELGCSNSISFSIYQPDNLEIDVDVEPLTNDNAGMLEIQIEGGTPPYIIQTFGPSGYFANSAFQPDLLPGSYTWIVVDANGCSISGNASIDDLSIGVNELNKQAITIYPNPATESIGIQTNCNIYALKILSCDGRIVENFSSNEPITHIDVSAFAPGVYLLDIASSCGNTIRKFAVQ
ncbi:MAG: T9SS type A sorting domain-containing protein, partial [Flavobacteriales bacterium]|nr:T9SS type A sorting domain-containing protein [Flavobacteriales bacterium]